MEAQGLLHIRAVADTCNVMSNRVYMYSSAFSAELVDRLHQLAWRLPRALMAYVYIQ
jgi:hypothetical protein